MKRKSPWLLKTLSGAIGAAFSLVSTLALAIEPFVVKDIRVDGLQRTEVGTVFSYLPVKIGETFTDEKAASAIRALFATGFFKDVKIEAQNGVLIIIVDDVVNSGRTLLYALKPFLIYHPKKIQTLVLVERTHKAFPVSTDFSGLSVATTVQEHIFVEVKDDLVLGAYME